MATTTKLKATYSGDPSKSDRDYLRFLIGDTDMSDPFLSDSEINGILTIKGSVVTAAIYAAENLAAKFARLCDERVGDVSIKFSQKADAFAKLAKRLKQNMSITCARPYAGGISKSDKETTELESDRVSPKFTKDMHDNPRNNDVRILSDNVVVD